GLLVEDRFHETLILTERDRLAVPGKRKAADADIAAFGLGAFFRKANGCDLRIAIGAAGNFVLVDRVRLQSLDRLDANDPLVLRFMREHRRPGDVADGVNARHIRTAIAVGNNCAALYLHAELLEP